MKILQRVVRAIKAGYYGIYPVQPSTIDAMIEFCQRHPGVTLTAEAFPKTFVQWFNDGSVQTIANFWARVTAVAPTGERAVFSHLADREVWWCRVVTFPAGDERIEQGHAIAKEKASSLKTTFEHGAMMT